jgi:hypothetical protein
MLKNFNLAKHSMRAALFPCLLLLFAVTACGGGNSNSPTPTPGATPTSVSTSTPAPTPTTPTTPIATAPNPAAQFKVTSIDMAVNPTSIGGISCSTNLTVTYTATFHIPASSPGGIVQFGYTVNNGRAESMASLTFVPGETTRTYTFTWQGKLPIDHTYPEPGGIMVTSPNQLTSSLVGPTGMCS